MLTLVVFFILTMVSYPSSYGGEAQDLLAQGYASYQNNQWTAAIGPLERAVQLYPGYAEAHHLLGLVLTHLGKDDQAITALKRSIEAYPQFSQAYLDLGLVYQKQAKYELAERAFRQALMGG